MRLDWSRVPRALALVAWAAFFDWLWLSGEAGRYVGPRTSWVVPFGGIVLTAAALFQVAALRASGKPKAPSTREALGVLVLLAPLLVVASAPASSLGSLAVEKKRSSGEARAVSRVPEGADFTLYDIASAEISPEFAKMYKIGDGTPVAFDGFVSKTPGDDGTLELSRFLASCCAADAMPYSVDVRVPSGAANVKLDEWVFVTGRLAAVEDGLEVVAERLEPSEAADNPYGY
jgi:uncharacterized repeat protein (TIGR03943 family)